MPYLFYLSLNRWQRGILIFMMTSLVCFISYEDKISSAQHNHMAMKKKLRLQKNLLGERRHLINEATEIQEQINKNQTILNKINNSDNILELAKQSKIDEVEYNTEPNNQKSILLKSSWQKFLFFVSQLCQQNINSLPTKITVNFQKDDESIMPNISEDKNDNLQFYIALTKITPSLKYFSPNNSQEKNSEENIDIQRIQWLGYLFINNQALIFYRLPNNNYNFIKIGEKIPHTQWHITQITHTALILTNEAQQQSSIAFRTKGFTHENI